MYHSAHSVFQGETFSSFHFQYRIGETTVSKIVIETCVALHQALKEEYLKVSLIHISGEKVLAVFFYKLYLCAFCVLFIIVHNVAAL